MLVEDLLPWVALHLVPGLGPSLQRRLLQHFGEPAAIAFRIPASALAAVPGVRDGVAEAAVAARKDLAKRAEREIRECERRGVRLVRCTDAEYPASFESLPDGPLLLWMKGRLPEAVVRVAVVGSRRGTAYGRRVATGLASGLVLRGVEVVSGGARGIDTWAHLGALDAEGRTVAVLGSGLATPYPPENAALFERIAASGAVLSEFSLDTAPRPDHFPRRNRLISALSAAVVVVEASPRSGSLANPSGLWKEPERAGNRAGSRFLGPRP